MRLATSGAVLLGLSFVLCASCYNPKVETPDNQDDPFQGTSMDPNAAPVNQPPPPKNAKEPDMAFIKDMSRRSAEQAAKCDAPENKGPRDVATINVTFEPIGQTGEIVVQPPHAGTPMGDCIKRAFEKVFVTAWEGEAVTVTQKVDFKAKKQVEPE